MSILNQITVIFASTLFFGAILRYLKQPIFLAYVFVGLFIGTYFFNGFGFVSDNQVFEVLVSILLFVSGLNINLKHLKQLGEDTLIKNVFAFLVVSILFYFSLNFLGFDILESLILSLCLSFSSSVIFSKIVSDDLLDRNLFNKIASSHLFVQSIFLLFTLVFLNSFTFVKTSGDFYNLLIENFIKTVILIVNLYLVSRYIVSRFEKFISSSNELLFLFVIAFGFGVVSLFRFLNLSYELGALVGGVLLSMHSFSFEVVSKLKVIREFSLLGFFVFLGAGLNFNVLSDKFLLILILIVLVTLFKIFINLLVEKLFSTPVRENFFSSLSLTSVSEFSIVIILLSISNNLINQDIFTVIGFIYVFLAILNVYFIKNRGYLYDKYFDTLQFFKSKKEVIEKIIEVDVLLLGCGKLGFDFLEHYKYLDNKLLVVDYDLDVLKKLKKLKIKNSYGDLSDKEFFENLPYFSSKLIYLSISDSGVVKEILNKLKNKKYPGVKIVVSYTFEDSLEFYRLGADYVVMPEYISGKYVSELTLDLGFSPKKYLAQKSFHLESLKLKESYKL